MPQIDDLEREWLLAKLGASYTGPTHVNDLWHAYWDSLVVTPGHFNDRAYEWLGTLGHVGSIDDRWFSFWNSF